MATGRVLLSLPRGSQTHNLTLDFVLGYMVKQLVGTKVMMDQQETELGQWDLFYLSKSYDFYRVECNLCRSR